MKWANGYETSANYTLVFYMLTVKHLPISDWHGSDQFRHVLTFLMPKIDDRAKNHAVAWFFYALTPKFFIQNRR